MFQCLSQGQLALFVGGLATGGLLLLPHREKWSGLLLGLSLIKPHIVAAVFFYAVLKKKWRPLFWAALTFVLLAVLAECAFGAGMWRAFFDALWGAKRIVEHGSAPISKMTTVFAAGKLFGLGNAAAYLLQGLSAVIALAGVAYAVFVVRNVWIERASVLAACLLLPHYAYDYDWTLVLFSVFALVRAWTEAGQDMASAEAASFPVWNWPPRAALVTRPDSSLAASVTDRATLSACRPRASRVSRCRASCSCWCFSVVRSK